MSARPSLWGLGRRPGAHPTGGTPPVHPLEEPMPSRRPSEPPARPTSGQSRPARRLLRRVGVVAGLLAGATMLGACNLPWTAPESTVPTPTTSTPALAPVPGGGGSLVVVNPLAYQVQSPGRDIPGVSHSRSSGGRSN